MSKIYLISPSQIELAVFKKNLIDLLKTGLVPVFQLRLKDHDFLEVKKIAQELNKICQDYNCLFILNDNLHLALEEGFGGAHLGQQDIKKLKEKIKLPQNFVLGVSCYDSLSLAFEAEEFGASYVSFGAFFPTKTKKALGFPKPTIIKDFNERSSLPTVAIGGINHENCSELIKNGADFLAVVSYVWQSQNPTIALKKLNQITDQRIF